MFAYVVRRLLLMLVTLFGVSIVIFVLLRIVPGSIVDILFAAAGYVDPTDKVHLEQELGIDRPMFVSDVHTSSALMLTGPAARDVVHIHPIDWENPSANRYHVALNGVYGTGMAHAVTLFQKRNGITADGVVNQLTWRKLF